jgi:hypothetical protein
MNGDVPNPSATEDPARYQVVSRQGGFMRKENPCI